MMKQPACGRSVHPYQTTMVPRSEHQHTSAAQHRVRHPWTEDVPPHRYATTDSSSDPAYQLPQYYGPPSPVYHSPYATDTWKSYRKGQSSDHNRQDTYMFPQCSSAFSLPMAEVEPAQPCAMESPVPPIASPEVPIIGACGGHCPGFEYVCYYILQIIFVVGILTGISLSIAGLVLRRTNRNGDLGVLVYIGFLSSSVCGVLLGVQCCVRREIRQRKLRANLHIPMQPIVEAPAAAYPLLASTLPCSQIYLPTTSVLPDEDVTGVPWWRRNRD